MNKLLLMIGIIFHLPIVLKASEILAIKNATDTDFFLRIQSTNPLNHYPPLNPYYHCLIAARTQSRFKLLPKSIKRRRIWETWLGYRIERTTHVRFHEITPLPSKTTTETLELLDKNYANLKNIFDYRCINKDTSLSSPFEGFAFAQNSNTLVLSLKLRANGRIGLEMETCDTDNESGIELNAPSHSSST